MTQAAARVPVALKIAYSAFMAVLDIQITNASLKDVTGALGATPQACSLTS